MPSSNAAEQTAAFTRISGKILPGYGVASGKGLDKRYPQGTLRQQSQHFLERGLDLSAYYMGTINLDITPYTYEIKRPKFFFKNIDWSSYIPPENFYFFDAELYNNGMSYEGLVYMPDPSTKEDHVQKPTVLELIFPKIEELEYGATVEIALRKVQLELIHPSQWHPLQRH